MYNDHLGHITKGMEKLNEKLYCKIKKMLYQVPDSGSDGSILWRNTPTPLLRISLVGRLRKYKLLKSILPSGEVIHRYYEF